jgi:hypothetical protein
MRLGHENRDVYAWPLATWHEFMKAMLRRWGGRGTPYAKRPLRLEMRRTIPIPIPISIAIWMLCQKYG